MANNIPNLNLIDKEQVSIPSISNKNSVQNKLRISPELRKMHYLYQEYAFIVKKPIEGIYILPSAKNQLIWYGAIIVRSGIFCGGIFRFTLTIPNDFPDTKTIPTVKFDEPLFHPFVYSKTNIAQLRRKFPSGWQRDRNHLYQVLTAIQSMFFRCEIDAPQAANPEAAILIKQDRHKFKQLAREAVRRSRTQIYEIPNNEDENSINFIPWNEQEMEPFRKYLIKEIKLKTLLNQISPKKSLCAMYLSEFYSKKAGYSWINPENCQYMCDSLSLKKTKSD